MTARERLEELRKEHLRRKPELSVVIDEVSDLLADELDRIWLAIEGGHTKREEAPEPPRTGTD